MILDNAPARSAELLGQNRVDAALVPVIAYQSLSDVLLVPEVCVGARESVKSVCLVTNGMGLEDVKSVSLDTSSRTSVALTKIIFREFLDFEPDWTATPPNLEAMLAESDCALLIGDPALVIPDYSDDPAVNRTTSLRKFDLAELWRKHTGFGFVFAMWMANSSRSDVARSIDFAAARDEGIAHLDEIIANYESRIPIEYSEFRRYLTEHISFTIDESMQQGLELFFQLAHKNSLIDSNRPLQFI